MKDLVEKLGKALDELERLALEALAEREESWWRQHTFIAYSEPNSTPESVIAFLKKAADPRATLRRVAAHRKLLAMLKLDEDGDIAEVVVPGEVLCDDWCIRAVGEHLLKALAEEHDLTDDSTEGTAP